MFLSININGRMFFLKPGLMCVQVLGEEEKVFRCVMHNQEVTAYCQDVMQMSQLLKDIAKNYGPPDLSQIHQFIVKFELALLFFY